MLLELQHFLDPVIEIGFVAPRVGLETVSEIADFHSGRFVIEIVIVDALHDLKTKTKNFEIKHQHVSRFEMRIFA